MSFKFDIECISKKPAKFGGLFALWRVGNYFLRAAMLSSSDLILLSASACFLRSISTTLAGALLTKRSLPSLARTERNESFRTSAEVYTRYAEAEVRKNAAFIQSFDINDMAYYRRD